MDTFADKDLGPGRGGGVPAGVPPTSHPVPPGWEVEEFGNAMNGNRRSRLKFLLWALLKNSLYAKTTFGGGQLRVKELFSIKNELFTTKQSTKLYLSVHRPTKREKTRDHLI